MLDSGVTVPSERTSRGVRKLVEDLGFARAAKLLNCHREAVARIIASMPVRHGTIALVEKNLTDIGQTAA